jgi:hypothetical protein
LQEIKVLIILYFTVSQDVTKTYEKLNNYVFGIN